MEKYICPMHPEVQSDSPDRCLKCGMALVLESEASANPSAAVEDTGLGDVTWQSYMPLIVVGLMITVVSLITSWSEGFSLTEFLLDFMTGFFLVFAGFKLADLKGFAEGYSTYDLLAQRWFAYGYIYPFIELGFGLLMLSGFHPAWLLWTELGVMLFSGVGVAIKIARKEKFTCACLGTFLKVPLTKVTLVEDFGMAATALALILLL